MASFVEQARVGFASDSINFVTVLLRIVQQFPSRVRLVEITHIDRKRLFTELVENTIVGALLIGCQFPTDDDSLVGVDGRPALLRALQELPERSPGIVGRGSGRR